MTKPAVPIVLALFAALLSAGALAVAIAAMEKPTKTTSIESLSSTVVKLRREMAALSTHYNELRSQVSALTTGQTKLNDRVRKMLTCLPEMEGEINGLTANVMDGSVYLSNTQQVSAYCSPVIYGAAHNGD